MMSALRATLAYALFPLGKTGGLIEANNIKSSSSPDSIRFPLGKTGGLIEARQHARKAKGWSARVSAG